MKFTNAISAGAYALSLGPLVTAVYASESERSRSPLTIKYEGVEVTQVVENNVTEMDSILKGLGCSWRSMRIVNFKEPEDAVHPELLVNGQSEEYQATPLKTWDITTPTKEQLSQAASDWLQACRAGDQEVRSMEYVEMEEVGDVNAFFSSLSLQPTDVLVMTSTRPSSSASLWVENLKKSLGLHAKTLLGLKKRQLVALTHETLAETIQEWEEILSEEEGFEEAYLESEFPDIFAEDDEEWDIIDPDASAVTVNHQVIAEDNDEDGYMELLAKHGHKTNGTIPVIGGGLYGRATIISTPVLTALLITIGILLPVMFCGIRALATIQVPRHMMSTAKTMVSQSKKEQ